MRTPGWSGMSSERWITAEWSTRASLASPHQPARYNRHVITRGIREFMSRDWAAVRDAKDTYWGDRIACVGPLEGFRIADDLWRQALLTNPSWPDPADRRDDLAAHVRLAGLLRHAHHAGRR